MEDSLLKSGAVAAAEPAGTGVFASETSVAGVGGFTVATGGVVWSAALLNCGDTADKKQKGTIVRIFAVRRVFP